MSNVVSNKKTGFLLVVMLVLVLLGAVYYYVIYPLKEEKNTKEVTVSNVRNEIAVLQEQLVAPEEVEVPEENTFMLQKKVPATRALDELIRSIEKVELISESKIESINFNNYDAVVANSSLAPPVTEGQETEENTGTTETPPQNTESTSETVADVPVSPVAATVLPPQLKLITLEIAVLAKDDVHLKTFIQELEKLERIVRIDQLAFSMPGEEQLYQMDSEETVSATIQLTTFFYDGQN